MSTISRTRSGRAQRVIGSSGFTLAELMVALAVSAIIVVGASMLVRHLIVASAENRDQTLAVVQVQTVGFWVSNDLVQAQAVELGDPEGIGFPLTIQWTEWDGDRNRVEYRVEGTLDELDRDLWLMFREHTADTGSGYEAVSSSIVADSLDPGASKCYWSESSNDVLVLEVSVKIDRGESSSTYEIHPRTDM